MRRPLLVLFLAWVAGLLLGDLFHNIAPVILFTVTVVIILFGIVLSGKCSTKQGILQLLALIMLVLGFLRHSLAEQAFQRKLDQVATIQPTYPAYIRGVLFSQFQQASVGRWSACVTQPSLWDGKTWQQLPGPIEINSATQSQPRGQAGQKVEFSGRWKDVEGAASPGKRNIREWRQSTGVVGTLKVKGSPTSLEEPQELSFLFSVIRTRDHWRARVREWMLSHLHGARGGLALAMTTGERGYLEEDVRRNLLESGLYHLTAISGLNVTIVLLTLPLFLKLVGIRRRWRALLGIPLALLLLGLTGAQVSVLRATIMGITLMLALFMDHLSEALNSLAAAGLMILVIYPSEIHQPGFLLSFVTVAALVLGGMPDFFRPFRIELRIQRWIKPGIMVHSFLNAMAWVGTGLWASLVATLAVAPISAWFFHTVAWKALLANLVAIPVAEMITVLGVLAAFGLAFIPGVGAVLIWPLSFFSNLLLEILQWVSGWPFGFEVVLSPDPVTISLLLAVGLVLMLPLEWFRPPFLSRRVTALLLLACLSWWPLLPESRMFRIHFLDVGQGDACLLQFPRGETLLVDTGPPSPGLPNQLGVVTNTLLSMGISHLDGVVLTHPEADHMGGLPQLLKTVSIGKLIATGDTNESPSFQNFLDLLGDCQLPTERLLAGDHLAGISDATVTALYPGIDEIGHPFRTRNECSLVLLVEQAGLAVLLPGDISADVERDISGQYPALRCDILKVPHHGSQSSSSSDFLQQVRPSLAVISCGDNLFGHPSLETIQRLEEVGAKVLVTRYDGTIQLSWNGERLVMDNWKAGKGWRP